MDADDAVIFSAIKKLIKMRKNEKNTLPNSRRKNAFFEKWIFLSYYD